MKYLILILFFGFIYYYLFKKKDKGFEENKEPVEELVFDEICQTYIRKKDAIKVEINGKTYYFCSKKCLQEFLEKTPKLQP